MKHDSRHSARVPPRVQLVHIPAHPVQERRFDVPRLPRARVGAPTLPHLRHRRACPRARAAQSGELQSLVGYSGHALTRSHRSRLRLCDGPCVGGTQRTRSKAARPPSTPPSLTTARLRVQPSLSSTNRIILPHAHRVVACPRATASSLTWHPPRVIPASRLNRTTPHVKLGTYNRPL